MGALESRLHDINERLALSSSQVSALARLARRREALFATSEDVRERLDAARAYAQRVQAQAERSPSLFKYAPHRRLIEAFLQPHGKEGYVAASLYLVLEHELRSIREELGDVEQQIRRLSGMASKHEMLAEWRDELIAALGPGRVTAAESALSRVSVAVEVAQCDEDVRVLESAQSVARAASSDIVQAAREVERVPRVEKDDLAVLADLIPEETGHFPLREAKRRLEQATLRFGYVQDLVLSVEGLNVELRHPYFALESFLDGVFEDYHGGGHVAHAVAALEDAQDYAQHLGGALASAIAAGNARAERARTKEAEVVGRAVDGVAPLGPARLTARFSKWDSAY